MDCEKALLLISSHLDQENTAEEEVQLQNHLETCPRCRRVLAAFLEIDGGLTDLEEEPPADLHEGIMNAVRAEKPRKRVKRRWLPTAAAAAAVALLIGVSMRSLPQFESKDEAAPMAVRTMDAPIEAASEPIIQYSMAMADMAFDPQTLADQRGANVAVSDTSLSELESYPCEILEDGTSLYCLESTEKAGELAKLYGLKVYQPAEMTADVSYLWVTQ